MRPHELAAGVVTLLERTPAFPESRLQLDMIANPRTGGFVRPRYARLRKAELDAIVSASASLRARRIPPTLRLHVTERSGHASELAMRILDEGVRSDPETLRILMTAGGDGTSLETAAGMATLPESSRSRFALVRLPFGTGNDGSEGRNLHTALGRFLGPLRFEPRDSLLVTPDPGGGKKAARSFNIASIGFDAFVALLTNRLKSRFPGDSYKLMVDLASVLYDRIYRIGEMRIRHQDGEKPEVDRGDRKTLLMAMGVSGRRQYGSDKKILPGEENVCVISQTSLWRKLAAKGPIERGEHDGVPEVEHFSASRIVVEYGERSILQCDGEVTKLEPRDFPLRMERMPGLYNVVVPASG